MKDYMLANFSTYLQFLDAVFISMLLKEIFSFWNPKFDNIYQRAYVRMNENEALYGKYLEEPLRQVKFTTNRVSEEFDHSISKRGAIMVIFTTLLLLFCGFEAHCNILNDDPIYRSLAISSFISFCFIAIFLNKYVRGFNLVYLVIIICPILVLVFFNYYEEVSTFIINYRIHIILVLIFFYVLVLLLRKKIDVKEVWIDIYFNTFTIIPLFFSKCIFMWCEQKPLFFILGFCTWEVFWEWILSMYYGKIYPDYIEKKINDVFDCIEENKNEEVIRKDIEKNLKLTISEDEHHSKFYLFNFDVWGYPVKKFLNRLKNYFSKFKKTKKREGVQIDKNKTESPNENSFNE